MSRRGLPAGLSMRHDAHYVEELTQPSTTHVGRLLPIDKLDPNPDQPRTEIGDLTELTASILEKGVLEPLLVKPNRNGRWMIIAGERRWRAATAAGLEEVPCIEMDVNDAEVAEIALIENMQRKDLTPWEEADGLRALSEKFGYTHEEVARKVGKSRSTVTEALSIAAIPNSIREICRACEITSKSLLLQIVRQPDDESMQAMAEQIAAEGLTRDGARRARKAYIDPTGASEPYVYRFE
ncbi:MAG: ParB/RepB/Spo0J family partition protein, partial [Pyrinomonadaceae bacterium]